MVVAGFALLAAALGEVLARLPADACSAVGRGEPPRAPAVQLLTGGVCSLAVLGAAVGTAATVRVAAGPAGSWAGAATAVALGLVPLAAAPVTAAPLLGAPLRIGLLGWCAVRAFEGLGAGPAALLALLAGAAVAAALGDALGPRRLAEALRQTVRDTVSVLVAAPIALAVGVVPLLVGLPLAPAELWRYCLRNPPARTRPPDREGAPRLFVIYLDGVGKTRFAPTRVARDLRSALDVALPEARLVTDVLPYSPVQVPLTERPGSGPLWRCLRRRAFPMLVGHNILQTLVAGDARYQPAYGRALAEAMAGSVCRAGYRIGDRVAVVGYSGGAVIGVAAADALAELLGTGTLMVVSIGGYLDGHRLPRRATVHHLASRADRLERLGRMMFPARWAVAGRSAWHRGLARGGVVHHEVPGPRHIGPRGYLAAAPHADGTSYLARTVAVTARLLQPDLRR